MRCCWLVGDTFLCSHSENAALKSSDVGGKEFSISTYNIGFGAYERDYSFFMDKSKFKEEYQESQGQVNTAGKKSARLIT